MSLKNCPECGKLFLDNSVGVCPDCYAKREQDELKVADYLREVRKASLEEIHQATGVKHNTIMRMLNAGRIFSDFEVTYPCENCGAAINQGRLCTKCSQNFLEQVNNTPKKVPEEKTGKTGRMYTQDIFKR